VSDLIILLFLADQLDRYPNRSSRKQGASSTKFHNIPSRFSELYEQTSSTETHGMPTAIPEISPSNQDSTIRVNQTVINASLKGVTTFFGKYMCLKRCGSGFSPGGSIRTTHGGNPPRHVSWSRPGSFFCTTSKLIREADWGRGWTIERFTILSQIHA
jgi:hypothetical protein